MTAESRTHAGCPGCRLRLALVDAAYLTACPDCGGPLHVFAALSEAMGYRLFRQEDPLAALREAVAVSIQIPDPGIGRP